MFFTAAGYEQATRLSVGALHAERFLAAGARRIVDFGCGVGADSLAFCLAGLDVTAIEVDPGRRSSARTAWRPGSPRRTGYGSIRPGGPGTAAG